MYRPDIDLEQEDLEQSELMMLQLQSALRDYCQNVLHLKFRILQHEAWSDFFADTENSLNEYYTYSDYFDRGIIRFRDYVRPSDLPDIERRVAKDIARGDDVTLAARMLAHAHELVQLQQFNYALIEAVMALELAIGEFSQGLSPTAIPWASKSKNLPPLGRRLELTASQIGISDTRVLKRVQNTISLRNKVVHEGRDVMTDLPDHLRNDIMRLLDVAACYLQQPFRFVSPPYYPLG